MFTGLVQHVGLLAETPQPMKSGVRLRIDALGWSHHPKFGESIAVDGCCLTVVGSSDGVIEFDVIPQTLDVTSLGGLGKGDRVNLEHAVTPTTLLGGHLVQGHVDVLGNVLSAQEGAGGYRCRIATPASHAAYLVPRGAITIAGVSLTIAELGDAWFEVALIPTTLSDTTLGELRGGCKVNLEFDVIAKMVAAQLATSQAT